MVNDTVREELETKIERRISKPLEIPAAVKAIHMEIEEVLEMSDPIVAEPMAAEPIVAAAPVMQDAEPTPVVAVKNVPVVREPRGEPTERIVRHTSPTLVEFQNKNSNKPDWRIQLQNAVRQRKSDVVAAPVMTETAAPFQARLATSGANALKAQYVAEQAPMEPAAVVNEHVSNQRVANALKRIEDSRRRFSAGEPAPAVATVSAPAPAKNYPFNVVSRSGDIEQPVKKATVNAPPKPRLVSSFKFEKRGLDTNKLPPIPATPTPVATPASNTALAEAFPIEETLPKHDIVAVFEETGSIEEVIDDLPEETDDLAPISTRFTSGIFDVIISGFATAILMSPLLIYGGSWLSFAGVLTIAAVFGIVTFLYTTAMLGLRGQTLGMKLFGLEVVDVESNEYPTLHQAAVSSAVFLLSLPFFGIGFIPAFLSEERRGAHDLVSGTIVVREV
jgi:uncharacterized RDD family membrane protein YckC